jgi:hypothetical protein
MQRALSESKEDFVFLTAGRDHKSFVGLEVLIGIRPVVDEDMRLSQSTCKALGSIRHYALARFEYDETNHRLAHVTRSVARSMSQAQSSTRPGRVASAGNGDIPLIVCSSTSSLGKRRKSTQPTDAQRQPKSIGHRRPPRVPRSKSIVTPEVESGRPAPTSGKSQHEPAMKSSGPTPASGKSGAASRRSTRTRPPSSLCVAGIRHGY